MRHLFQSSWLAALLVLVAPMPCLAQRSPDSNDLKPPSKDLQKIEGEIVWLQGAILRANPAPYRNPQGPVAAYEQGLLDEEGQLWTILDTPEGRELRYNPDLRGKKIQVEGWLFPKSQIIEVKDWLSGKHKARANQDFEEPERPPFNPLKAETIESIPPIPLRKIDESTLDQDLWRMGEGYDLGVRMGGEILSATNPAAAIEVKSLLDKIESELGRQGATAPAPLAPATPAVSPQLPPRMEDPPEAEPPGFVPSPSAPPAPQREPPLLNQEGQPLTTPEEFDSALQKELIEQISPQKP